MLGFLPPPIMPYPGAFFCVQGQAAQGLLKLMLALGTSRLSRKETIKIRLKKYLGRGGGLDSANRRSNSWRRPFMKLYVF
jgi:hypothetical protein